MVLVVDLGDGVFERPRLGVADSVEVLRLGSGSTAGGAKCPVVVAGEVVDDEPPNLFDRLLIRRVALMSIIFVLSGICMKPQPGSLRNRPVPLT